MGADRNSIMCFPPPHIQKIFQQVIKDEGLIDAESIDLILSFHEKDLGKQSKDNRLKYLHIMYRAYVAISETKNPELIELYGTILDSAIDNLNFNDNELALELQNALSEYREERVQMLVDGMKKFESVRSG